MRLIRRNSSHLSRLPNDHCEKAIYHIQSFTSALLLSPSTQPNPRYTTTAVVTDLHHELTWPILSPAPSSNLLQQIFFASSNNPAAMLPSANQTIRMTLLFYSFFWTLILTMRQFFLGLRQARKQYSPPPSSIHVSAFVRSFDKSMRWAPIWISMREFFHIFCLKGKFV